MPDVITTISDPTELALRFARGSFFYPQQSDATKGRITLISYHYVYSGVTTGFAIDPVSELFDKLDSMQNLENAHGYTFSATPHAYKNAKLYLEGIRFQMSADFRLRPSLMPDGEGGIDIEWESGEKEITLSCRGSESQQDFIYWQGDKYDAGDATPELLRERLGWLIRE